MGQTLPDVLMPRQQTAQVLQSLKCRFRRPTFCMWAFPVMNWRKCGMAVIISILPLKQACRTGRTHQNHYSRSIFQYAWRCPAVLPTVSGEGVAAWSCRLAYALSGWRAAYVGDVLGWHDRHALISTTYAASQVTRSSEHDSASGTGFCPCTLGTFRQDMGNTAIQ